MQNYDVVIKAHPKDYFKLDEVIDRLEFLNPMFENIYLVSPDGYIPSCKYTDLIIPVRDEEVIPKIDKDRFSHRPNWAWVNLVSLTQEFTKNDLYFDVQSDNFFTKQIDLFTSDGKPKLFKTVVNPNNNFRWFGYFDFSRDVFGIDKITYGSSFIIEFMMYDKKKLSKLFENFSDKNEMLEIAYEKIDEKHYPADQEIYGNLIEKYFSNDYEIVGPVQTILTGDELLDQNFDRVRDYIDVVENTYPDAVACSYHTWWMP